MTYHNIICFVLCPPYKMHFRGILTMRQTSYQQPQLQKKVDIDDREAFNMFLELMHSWVGYKLVKVLLNFGLSPKIWEDLEDWSPDLFTTLGTNNGILKKKNTLHIS